MLSASPLPAWLTFDGQVLRGIPLEQGEIQLQVKATNNVGPPAGPAFSEWRVASFQLSRGWDPACTRRTNECFNWT